MAKQYKLVSKDVMPDEDKVISITETIPAEIKETVTIRELSVSQILAEVAAIKEEIKVLRVRANGLIEDLEVINRDSKISVKVKDIPEKA
jgi:hypothetical protein